MACLFRKEGGRREEPLLRDCCGSTRLGFMHEGPKSAIVSGDLNDMSANRLPHGCCTGGTWCVALLMLMTGLLPTARATVPTIESPTPQGHYIFRSYGANDGLLDPTILQLLQDTHGFIWAGTDDGLYRYDGFRFDRFGVDEGLPSAVIDALHEDRQGVLWAGTRAGLSRWNGTGFVTIANAIATGDVIHAIADNAEGVWLASTRGLSVVGADLSLQPARGWSGGEATALLVGSKVTGLWVAQWDGQAHVLRHEADAWHSYALANESPHERIDAFAEDGQGRLWARSATQLWALNAAQQAFEHVDTPRPLTASAGAYLTVGRRGDLWVSNDVAMHRQGDRWTDVLGGAVIGARPMLEDREGSLWFGVRGLQRLVGRGVFHAYDISEGLPGNVVWSMVRDTEQTLWVGTDHGLAHAVGDRFETIPGTEAQLVRSIAAAPDGKVYLAGVPANEILSYDPALRQLSHHALDAAITPERILHLLLDRHGILWASTNNAGLLKADTRDLQLHFSREALPDGAPGELLRGLHEDAAGRLWVAGRRGLAVCEDGRWRRLTSAEGLSYNDVNYVTTTRNGDVLIVYNGSHGFDRSRYEQGRLRILRHFDNTSARYADEIFSIGEDANQNIWIGSGRGIDLHTPLHTEHFTLANGLLGEDTASMAFLAEPNGDVWIGVVGGLMRFDAAAYKALPPRTAPPADLLDIRLGSRAFTSAAQDVQVPHTANSFQVRFASLSFIGNGIVQYKTRLDGLTTAEEVTDSRYANYPALPPGDYRFEVAARTGSLGTWGTPATFAFHVLPAWWQTWWARVLYAVGIVLALALAVQWRMAALRQNNRRLEDNVAKRTIELRQTNALLQSEIDDRLAAESAVQQRNAELETLNRRLAGTQSQLLQSEKMASVGQLAAGVAHEINNPIGFVHSNLGSLKRYVEDIFNVLGIYERLEHALPHDHPDLERLRALKQRIELDFLRRDTDELLAETLEGVTRVKKIVQDLKNFSHLDEAEWQRVDLHKSLDSTLNVVAHELKYKADVVKEYGVVPPVRCLPFQLNQVFLNLLVNAAHAIDGRGTVTLRTGCDEDTAWVTISDTGRGVEPAILHRIFEPFFTTKPVGSGTGLGLSVSYGIVQKHGGTIEAASVLGSGTTFTIRLPIDGPPNLGSDGAIAPSDGGE